MATAWHALSPGKRKCHSLRGLRERSERGKEVGKEKKKNAGKRTGEEEEKKEDQEKEKGEEAMRSMHYCLSLW